MGPRRAEANEQEERALSERRRVVVATGDACPVPSAPLSELSQRLLGAYRIAALPEDIIAANQRSVEQQLAALRLFDLRRNCATIAGVVLLGIGARFHLPGAYVQFLYFPGTNMSEMPVDQQEIDGDLQSVVDALHARVKLHNRVRMVPGPGGRAYPIT